MKKNKLLIGVIFILSIFFLFYVYINKYNNTNYNYYIYKNEITGDYSVKGKLDKLNFYNCYGIYDVTLKEKNNLGPYDEKCGDYSFILGSTNTEYLIYKNGKFLLKYSGYIGNDAGIDNVGDINGIFTFQTYRNINGKVNRDIYYNNSFLTDKFILEEVFNLFSYKGKMGFIGKKDGKMKIYFIK